MNTNPLNSQYRHHWNEESNAALAQGLGITEFQTVGEYLETTVKTLSHDECEDWIEHNQTTSRTFRQVIRKHLDRSVKNLICTHGVLCERNKETIVAVNMLSK